MRWNIMITDVSFPDVSLELAELQSVDASLVRLNCKTPNDVIQQCQQADALLVQYAPLTTQVLNSLPRLKAISRYGIGVDMIDIPTATKNNVAVCNVPGYCIEEVATHALTMILYWARRLSTYQQDVRDHKWNLSKLDSDHCVHRLRGQTLGLVGAGRIAQKLATMADALGISVVYYDPYIHVNPFDGMRPVSFEELIKTSDFISIHCPLTNESRGLFDEQVFRSMKPSSFLINTARGAVVNNSALEKALRNGWISGAGLDTVVPEPPNWDDGLLTAPNLVVTPHVAFYSEEALKDLQRLTAQAIVDLYCHKIPEGILNPEVFPVLLQKMQADDVLC